MKSKAHEKIVSVGIDVSKDELEVSIILYNLLTQKFKQLTRFTEDNTHAGIEKVIKKIRMKASQNGNFPVRITMEALQACLKATKKQIDILTRQAKDHLRGDAEVWEQVKDLKTIPGIGMVTIAAILAETNGF